MNAPTPKPRPVRHEDRAAGLLTRAEYVRAAYWADGWRVAAVLLALLALLSAARWQYVQAAQLATQTDLIRPLTPAQAAWIRQAHQRHAPPRLADLARWTPEGWAAQYPAQWRSCQQRERCAANLKRWAATLAQTPEMRAEQHRTQATTTAAAVALLAAMLAAVDVRDWRNRERDALEAPTRRRLQREGRTM